MSNRRLGVLFDTSVYSHYFFDSGTGKVLKCTEDEKELIKRMLEDKISLDEACEENNGLKELMDEENIFKSPDSIEFIVPM